MTRMILSCEETLVTHDRMALRNVHVCVSSGETIMAYKSFVT